jgi:hypothetical protein
VQFAHGAEPLKKQIKMGGLSMYNDIEKCANHIDYESTSCEFRDLFDLRLYGYYNPMGGCQCGNPAFKEHHLTFVLFFGDPFDPLLDEPIFGRKDFNGFCKHETDTFESLKEFEEEIKKKDIQIVTLEYKDGTRYSEPEFLERLFGVKSYLPQVTGLKEHSMLYKVTVNIPIDVIADYITVDKVFYTNAKQKVNSIYNPKDTKNIVQQLFLKMKRAESNIEEMGMIFDKIKKDPARFKRDNADNSWAKECVNDGLNIEHADTLYRKLKTDMDNMHKVLWQARYFDIHAEVEEPVDTKCSHKVCTRQKVEGSDYCNQCVQLNTKECNFCKKEK